MKKARLLLPLFLLFVIPVTGQVEHVFPEQCWADADVWGVPKSSVSAPNENQFLNLAVAMMHDQTVTSETLDARIAELGQCEKTSSIQSGRYVRAKSAYSLAELGRMAHFMQRHNLTAQFYQEDERGQR
jgi:hypothetical protein